MRRGRQRGHRAGLCRAGGYCGRIERSRDKAAASPGKCRGAGAARNAATTRSHRVGGIPPHQRMVLLTGSPGAVARPRFPQNVACSFCFAAPSVSAPGSCRRSDATGIRGLGSSSGPWAQAVGNMPVPALCPGHALVLALPSTLPSTLSAPRLSAGVVRGFIGTIRPSDSSYLPIRLRLLAFPNRPGIAVATAGSRSRVAQGNCTPAPSQNRT
jgi:hypothetical protein